MSANQSSSAESTSEGIERKHWHHLEKFIEELERDHLSWYDRQQRRYYALWIALEVVSVAAPLLTTIFAGIASAADIINNVWVKCLLVALPACAVASSSMLARLGFREMENTREVGRHEFEFLIRNARIDAQLAKDDPKQLVTLHRMLVAEAARIDAQQHQEHHKISRAAQKEPRSGKN